MIGKTIERNDKKYHIIGMTLADEAKLYIIEPYNEPECHKHKRKDIRNQREILKEHEENNVCYLHCSDFYLGTVRLQVQGGSSGSLKYSLQNYGEIQLFLDMMGAG